LRHAGERDFAVAGPIAGEQQAQRQRCQEHRPEAFFVGRAGQRQPGDAGQEEREGNEGAARPPRNFRVLVSAPRPSYSANMTAPDEKFTLYDLRVEVVATDRPMVCNHRPGDFFELSGEDLRFPPGQTFPSIRWRRCCRFCRPSSAPPRPPIG